jgi:hypothetical protein
MKRGERGVFIKKDVLKNLEMWPFIRPGSPEESDWDWKRLPDNLRSQTELDEQRHR